MKDMHIESDTFNMYKLASRHGIVIHYEFRKHRECSIIPQFSCSSALLAQQVVESLAERSCVLFRALSPRFPLGKHHLLLTSNCTSFVVLFVPANAPLMFSL
jgi:hypothetical protein